MSQIPLGANFISKNICNGYFVSGYESEPLINDYVTHVMPNLSRLWNVEIDVQGQKVFVSDKFRKNNRAVSIHRFPIGCVNVGVDDPELLRMETPNVVSIESLPDLVPWPYGRAGIDNSQVDQDKLEALEIRLDQEYSPKTKTVASVVVIWGSSNS